MAPTPGNQEQANELQKVCAKIAKLEEELEAGKGDNELKRSLAKRLAALEEQKTLLMRQSSGGTGAVAGTVTAEEVAGMVKAIQDQAGMVKAMQDQLSGLNISPRLSASTIKHVKDSMFLIFQEGTRSMLTATALAALASNVPYVPSGSGMYTGDMFVGAGFFYRQPGLAVTPAHQLTKMQIDGGEAVRILAPSSRKELVLKVVKVDSGLDFAYLRLEGAAPEPGAGADFLVAHGESLSDVACRRVTLFTANIGQWRQLGEALPNALITQCSANFSLVGSKNMTYSATTFKGDCGCPVIMTSSGELAGMHTEMINEYEWSTGSRKRKVDARLSDLESSAASSGPHEAVALQASAFPPVPAL